MIPSLNYAYEGILSRFVWGKALHGCEKGSANTLHISIIYLNYLLLYCLMKNSI